MSPLSVAYPFPLFVVGNIFRVDLIVLLFFFTGCNTRLDPESYIKWLRDYDNHAHTKITNDEFVFDVQYQPSEYVLLMRGVKAASRNAITQELQKLSDIQYYVLTLSTISKVDLIRYGVNSEVERQQKQYYLSYNFQNDVTLEENGHTLPCVLFHSEQSAGVDGGRTFILGFENSSKNSQEAKLVISSQLFGSLPIKISVKKSNIPQVNL